ASKHYDAAVLQAASFTRELGTALAGEATVAFGSLVVANPAAAITGQGTRDAWLRAKWRRNFVTQWFGDLSWSRADFRMVLKGRLGQPMASQSSDAMVFPLSDLGDLLNAFVQTNTFPAASTNAGKSVPLVCGVCN